MKAKEELGAVVNNIGKIGSEPKGAEYVLQGVGAGGTYVRFGDVGYDTPHGPGNGGVSA